MIIKELRFFALIIFLFSVYSCIHRPQIPVKTVSAETRLIKQIESLLRDPNLGSAQAGIYIENLENGRVLYKRNAFKRFIPASNMKLYTTACALDRLGPEFVQKTRFYSNGRVVNGLLDGDLIIRGAGDPTVSGRFKEDDVFGVFSDWADSLKSMGIRGIKGKIIGDESYFKGSKLGIGWQWDDEPYWYSAQINALSFNDNCIDLEVIPGDSAGTAVKVIPSPLSDYVSIRNTAITVHHDSSSKLRITRLRADNTIEVSGQFPLDHKPVRTSITIEDPGTYLVYHVNQILDSLNIETRKEIQLSSKKINYDSLKLLFEYPSQEMGEIIRVVNKGSHNFYADQLFKTLGAEIGQKGDWKTAGMVVKDWLSSIGAADGQISIFDGSGLSRLNLVTPAATATLLRYMYRHPDFKVFYDSLPIAGIDGTLKRRMKGTRAENNVRAKTGYVMHARSLSGYCKDRDETPYLFVMMFNHYSVPTPYINELQNRICVLLSNMEGD